MLQAAGFTLFLYLFDRHLQNSLSTIRAQAKAVTWFAVVATIAHQLVEPARMTGAMSGVLDGSLHTLLLTSDAGAAVAVRIVGLVVMALVLAKPSRPANAAKLIGAMLVAVSFSLMGHTATHDQRGLLALLLIVHLLVVAFWFGALLPFAVASTRESITSNARLIEDFSRIATWLVPIIFVAGLAMAVVLLPDWDSLLSPYGISLIAKIAGFSVLMGLAALNKWRLGSLIDAGQTPALATFRRSVLAEWVLIAAVLVVTALMTALYSP